MELAALISSFLTPFLPHLLKLGEPVTEDAGKKIGAKLGEETWNKAKQVWTKLSPKVVEKPLAQGAVAALAIDADDEDAKDALTKQIKKLLTTNPELADNLQQMLNNSAGTVQKVVSVTQTVTGNKNIVIGEASGAINITQG